MNIRQANVDDWQNLLDAIHRCCVELTEKYDSPDMEPVISQGAAFGLIQKQGIFLAEMDKRLIGFCIWVRLENLPPGMVLGMGTWVDPEHRREGVSQELRQAAVTYWRENGAEYVIGTAAAQNIAGLKSVESEGFRVTGVEVRLDF